MTAQPQFQQRLKSIERLLGEVEATADPNLRTAVKQIMQLVMELHGSALERMLELIHASNGEGSTVIEKLGRDELVASLLILYGLHPLDIEARVGEALEKMRPKVHARDGNVELVSIQDGAVRLRLHAGGQGCGSTAQALKGMVEDALYEAAPDLTVLIVEGAEEKPGFVPIAMLQGARV